MNYLFSSLKLPTREWKNIIKLLFFSFISILFIHFPRLKQERSVNQKKSTILPPPPPPPKKKPRSSFYQMYFVHLMYYYTFIYLYIYNRRKHHFGPYILGSRSIQSLHFDSSQFDPCYFQLAVNLDITVNSLTKNVYVANGLHCWHTLG